VAAECIDQHLGLGKGLGVAWASGWNEICLEVLVEIVLFDVHHVRGQLVAQARIVIGAAADEDQRKTVLRIGLDHLVDPAGHAAADIG
jgi:hypothetical protein